MDMWYFARICAHARSWREFAKCRFVHFPSFFSVHVDTYAFTTSFFHSVRRNPSLNRLHRHRSLAILGHAGPRWRIRLSLHLVLGLPCRLVHSRGVHSVTLFVHLILLSLNRAMCPAHPCIPFLITSIIYTCLMSYYGCGHAGLMPSMMRSILRCATDSSFAFGTNVLNVLNVCACVSIYFFFLLCSGARRPLGGWLPHTKGLLALL